MPVPRLFKRHSEKNLRQPAQSDTEEQTPAPRRWLPPPLPQLPPYMTTPPGTPPTPFRVPRGADMLNAPAGALPSSPAPYSAPISPHGNSVQLPTHAGASPVPSPSPSPSPDKRHHAKGHTVARLGKAAVGFYKANADTFHLPTNLTIDGYDIQLPDNAGEDGADSPVPPPDAQRHADTSPAPSPSPDKRHHAKSHGVARLGKAAVGFYKANADEFNLPMSLTIDGYDIQLPDNAKEDDAASPAPPPDKRHLVNGGPDSPSPSPSPDQRNHTKGHGVAGLGKAAVGFYKANADEFDLPKSLTIDGYDIQLPDNAGEDGPAPTPGTQRRADTSPSPSPDKRHHAKSHGVARLGKAAVGLYKANADEFNLPKSLTIDGYDIQLPDNAGENGADSPVPPPDAQRRTDTSPAPSPSPDKRHHAKGHGVARLGKAAVGFYKANADEFNLPKSLTIDGYDIQLPDSAAEDGAAPTSDTQRHPDTSPSPSPSPDKRHHAKSHGVARLGKAAVGFYKANADEFNLPKSLALDGYGIQLPDNAGDDDDDDSPSPPPEKRPPQDKRPPREKPPHATGHGFQQRMGGANADAYIPNSSVSSLSLSRPPVNGSNVRPSTSDGIADRQHATARASPRPLNLNRPPVRGQDAPRHGGAENGYDANTGATARPEKRLPADDFRDQDVLYNDLAEAWDAANKGAQLRKTDRNQKKREAGVLAVRGAQESTVAIAGVAAVFDAAGGTQAIEQGVNAFLEGSAMLMKALDEVAKFHPFIGVAVLAFKAVCTLETRRRENDKRIKALHVEMKDMMAVLVRLKDLRESEKVCPDGTSVKGRLEGLVKTTADDIKACANTCDTFSKKKLVVKVLKGSVWEGQLLKYVSLFTKRRSEFEFALTVNTSLGVDAANRTLSDVSKMTEAMNAKMEMFMKVFENLVPPEEKEMGKIVKQKGGAKTIQENDKMLRELSDFEPQTGPSQGGNATDRRARDKQSEFDELKDDLHVDPDVAMERNLKVFSRKFEVQQHQIQEEMARVVRREGDRIISAVTSGPHDKIIDPDVHEIWKEMGWRGSVKARHFVMALRDYFHERWGSDSRSNDASHASSPDSRHPDKWALDYLNVTRMQPISEAFDDDASGFVTVTEVNTFTTSRPLGWSLPHWIAFWAIGWQLSLTEYLRKIEEIIAKMFAILPAIQSANRTSVNKYLMKVHDDITTLQRSVDTCDVNESLQAKFSSHVQEEEARLKANLAAVDYDIDEMDTLALVTGPGRIEKFALPLIYLLLKRHFEIFRICQRSVVHPDELWDAADTMIWVLTAVYERVNVLQAVFKQQKVDVDQQFKIFAHGLFKYINNPSGLWAPQIVKQITFPECHYDDDAEEDVNVTSVLNYPVDQEELDFPAYAPSTRQERATHAASRFCAVLGTWNGFTYWPWSQFPCDGMVSMTLSSSTTQGHILHIRASGRSNASDFTITGECSQGESRRIINVSFKRAFPARFPAEYWYGQLDLGTDTIMGTCGTDPDAVMHRQTFILKRTAPEYLCFRPPPVAFEANKARALWSYVRSAIFYALRKRSWSWSFFRDRRDNRERFIELYIRSTEFGRPLDENEDVDLCRVRQTFTAADSRFYHSLAQYYCRRTTGHSTYCGNCKGKIGGARIICLVCQSKDTWNTVDLCEVPDCVAAPIERKDLARPHLPTHDIMKVRRIVHLRQFGQLDRAARQALGRARETVEKVGAGLTCTLCKNCTTQPCWYCVQCENGVFICNSCDAKGTTSFDTYIGVHDLAHDLVRCQELVEDIDTSIDDRLVSLEKRFDRLESKIDHRLLRMEKLLEALLKRQGVEPY